MTAKGNRIEMATQDLGTYHLRVELACGSGWIQEWNTGARYTIGTPLASPLCAKRIGPAYSDEDDVFENMKYMYLEGNYSCDCNKGIFLASAMQSHISEMKCGDSMKLKSLTAIRPDGSEEVLFEED